MDPFCMGLEKSQNACSVLLLNSNAMGMIEFSIFSISDTGADICGFFNVAQYDMCLCWIQLGAFDPFSRNHSNINMPRQDPVAWGPEFAAISHDVLNIRCTLLPYLYTLMYEAHTHGNTVVRPLLHEFVRDENTWSIDRQFLWGPALLITPALDLVAHSNVTTGLDPASLVVTSDVSTHEDSR